MEPPLIEAAPFLFAQRSGQTRPVAGTRRHPDQAAGGAARAKSRRIVRRDMDLSKCFDTLNHEDWGFSRWGG